MRKNERLYAKIQEINDRAQTVVLTMARGGQSASIHFEEGTISAISSSNPLFRLGRQMKNAGLIDEAELQRIAQDARRQKMFFGQAAVKKGLIDGDELLELLQEQAAQIMLHVSKENFDIRSIGKELLEFYAPARIDLQHLQLLMARKSISTFSIESGQMVVLKDNDGLTRLPWYPGELAVMGLLKNPRRVEELASMTGLDEFRLGKILSVFDNLGLIELADAPTEVTTAVVKRHGFPFDALTPQLSLSNAGRDLESFHNENSFFSEQFRTLKVKLSAMAYDRPVRVITVTSPDSQAGKSLISANLAAAFSQDHERKTILIDCDFRKPTIHSLIGASIEPGIIGYLQDDRLQSFCFMRRLENLFVMTAGGKASNSVELLSLEKMRNFIQYLRSEFHTIILDAPPLSPISDAHVLAGLSDGIVLVVRSGKTSYASLERAAKSLDPEGVLGVVLNDVPPLMFNTQYDYSYYGNANTGASYGGEIRPAKRMKNYLEDI